MILLVVGVAINDPGHFSAPSTAYGNYPGLTGAYGNDQITMFN